MPAGRPLKFNSVKELEERIDAFFEHCKEKKEVPTITGLAVALDTNRQTLLEYEKNEKPKYKRFSDTIKKAKQYIEYHVEQRLFSSNQVTGVIFNLKNNFGWKDKTEVDNTHRVPALENILDDCDK